MPEAGLETDYGTQGRAFIDVAGAIWAIVAQ
jgi:hypothetical protein